MYLIEECSSRSEINIGRVVYRFRGLSVKGIKIRLVRECLSFSSVLSSGVRKNR